MPSVRMATTADASAVRAIYAPFVEGTAVSFEEEVPTVAELAHRIEATQVYAPWLVCVEGERVVGYAYASRHRERAAYRWCVDVSVYIDARHRRAGVGRSLYASLFALLRLQGFRAAHAGITLPNEASVGFHESCGFCHVGTYRRVGFKVGAWHDVGWWQLELSDRISAPAEVRTPASLRETAEWRRALM